MKKRDDAESVGNDSNMSTSSNLEPFANDDLGTVMHVDIILGLKLYLSEAASTSGCSTALRIAFQLNKPLYSSGSTTQKTTF